MLLAALALPSSVLCQNVTTQQYDNSRSGFQSQETILTPSNVGTDSFGKLFSLPVIGHVYAQPLYVGGLTMADGTVHNVLFVATEQDYLYAFDADGNNPAQGYLWRDALLGTNETWTTYQDVNSSDIYPSIGITGTPVIDPTTSTLYVVSKSKTQTTPIQIFQRLHAINLVDGTEKMNGPIVIQATVPGTGDGGVTISFNPLISNQRAGLLLASTPNGLTPASVFITWASHGDHGPYHGWVIGYNASDISQQTGAWCDTPNGTLGGIWLAGGALSSDDAGNIFAASGNGSFDANTGGGDYGDTAFALALNGSTLSPTSYFTPSDQTHLKSYDLDMGVSTVTLLPTQTGPIPHLAIVADKSGSIYLMNRDNLGGYSPTNNTNLQTITVGNTIRTSMSFFNNTMYFASEGGPLGAWPFDPVAEQLATTPITTSTATFGCSDCGGGGTTPSFSANGTSNPIVWVLDNSGREKTPAILRAYDPSNLANVLYDSTLAPNNRDAAAVAVKFTTPVVANGHVYVGGINAVTAYGELSSYPTVNISASPTWVTTGGSSTLTVTATDATQVTLTGTDGSSYLLSPTGGTQTVSPTATTTYTATTTTTGTPVTAKASTKVTFGMPAATVTISANPPTVTAGSLSTLTVTAAYATQVTLTGTDGSSYTLSNTGGTQNVYPTATTTYTATATGNTGNVTATAKVTVSNPAATVTVSANPASITAGSSSTLTVSAANATQVTLTGTDGSSYTLSTSGGTQTVSPSATTTYTATAAGSTGNVTANATVTVTSNTSGGSCLPAAAGALICAPASGATVSSPLTLTAGAVANSGNLTAIRAYLDNVAVLTVNNPSATKAFQISQSISAAAGTHYLVIVGYQSTGGNVQTSENFTVSATSGTGTSGCLPSAAGALICAPTSGASTSSPVTITAGAMASSGNIAALRAYLDNVAILTVNNPSATPTFQFSQAVSATTGSHYLVIVGYQSTGGNVQTSENFTITSTSGGGTSPCAPSTGATICSPTQNATVSSPVSISAGATTSTGYLAAIRIYVDNVSQAVVTNPQQSKTFSINQAVAMSQGSHYVVIVGYPSTGGAVSASETITVQ